MFKYAIIANDYENTTESVQILENKLSRMNAFKDDIGPEYVFVVGGDGTFIKAIYEYQDILETVMFVPIHNGGIGFYTNINNDEDFDSLLDAVQTEDYKINHYDLLDVFFDGKHIYGVNEFKIVNETKAIFTTVKINGEFLERFHGSGLVFATSNGSSGYVKATGGAVILEDGDIWEMQELFPVSTNSYRTVGSPIILSKNHVVTLEDEVNSQDLVIDTYAYSLSESKVVVKIADFKVQVVVLPEYSVTKTSIIRNIFVKDRD